MRAIETTATVQKSGQLKLEARLQAKVHEKVKVIVLMEDDEEEQQWLSSVSKNKTFDFLKHKSEDIYSLKDGKSLS